MKVLKDRVGDVLAFSCVCCRVGRTCRHTEDCELGDTDSVIPCISAGPSWLPPTGTVGWPSVIGLGLKRSPYSCQGGLVVFKYVKVAAKAEKKN